MGATGEDTSLAPLLPDLMAALHSQAGLDVAAIARVGRTYEARMRAAAGRHTPAAAPPSWPTRVVDKMLRNSWNLGYAAIMLPQAKVSLGPWTHTWLPGAGTESARACATCCCGPAIGCHGSCLTSICRLQGRQALLARAVTAPSCAGGACGAPPPGCGAVLLCPAL